MRTHSGAPRESIWDYPHPPAIEPTHRRIQIIHAKTLVADTTRALRICETGHPPSYYLPPEDIRMELLAPNAHRTYCEWKGIADYFDLYVADQIADAVAWSYPTPKRGFESIRNYLAFYPGCVDQCLVDGEAAQPEPRDFYGGWITSEIEGPFR